MSRASDTAFDALHALLADSMSEELERNLEAARKPRFIENKETGEKEENPEWRPLDTKLLGVIRALLKDNGIDAPATSPRLSGLEQQLKDLDFDEARPN